MSYFSQLLSCPSANPFSSHDSLQHDQTHFKQVIPISLWLDPVHIKKFSSKMRYQLFNRKKRVKIQYILSTMFVNLNTFVGFGGASSCIITLYLQHSLPGSTSRVKQEAQRCIVKTGQTGNNGQPVEETEVPTHYQNHLQQRRQDREKRLT